ncbi:MAG TPA: hypothetical protein VJJ53_03480 [Candidatus Nanoarchaeia archaeon]|nr:hypothetical protein [Candidatus Nanoarchaeia archaeon]
MDKKELEIIISAIFLVVFMAFFFNSGASSFITGRASITGRATYDSIPADLKIAINNNDYSTDRYNVILNLHASNVLECRYRNSEVEYWSSWRSYEPKRSWNLYPGLGLKDVYFQCRNQVGESSVVSDSIVVVS